MKCKLCGGELMREGDWMVCLSCDAAFYDPEEDNDAD